MAQSPLSESDCLALAKELYMGFCDDLKAAENDNRARVRLVSRVQIAVHAASAGDSISDIRERLFGAKKSTI